MDNLFKSTLEMTPPESISSICHGRRRRRQRQYIAKYKTSSCSTSPLTSRTLSIISSRSRLFSVMCHSTTSVVLLLLLLLSHSILPGDAFFSTPNMHLTRIRRVHQTASSCRRAIETTTNLHMSTAQEERTATKTPSTDTPSRPQAARTYKIIKEQRKQQRNNSKNIPTTPPVREKPTTQTKSSSDVKTPNKSENRPKRSSSEKTPPDSDVRTKRKPENRPGAARTFKIPSEINTNTVSRSREEQRRSEERVNKAEMLLRDLLEEDPSSLVDKLDTNDGQATPPASSAPTSSSPPSSPSTPTSTDEPQPVPDSFWYNGNLQSGKGQYVTRWAKGVKVAEPLVKYDQAATEARLFKQPAKWLLRNVQIGVPLLSWALSVTSDLISGTEQSNRPLRAKQLTAVIAGLGPAIIKGGQALASRSDLLPGDYLEELQKLQDDVPRFENARAFRTVEEELGIEAFGDVFELVEEDPIAAASIGQVYRARLRSNGDVVALKIQRPGCEEVVALDLYVLRWWSGVANVLTRLFDRDIDVQSIIDDFGELIYRELDYVAEAANAQRFSELYAPLQDVFVPKVYSELTTSKVLTMEWVDGFRLTDSENLERYNLDREKLVDTLVQCSLRQILENGFFHADPHAGNLLACEDGKLCYLDFGMMSYASAQQRNGFLLAVVHIVNRDWDELVKMYQRLGFIPEGTDLKPIAIALENSLPDALSADVSELNFKNVVGKLGDIMYTYPFSLPPFYISIIRCLGVLEGLAIQVNPQARIISDAYPYIANRVLTDRQAELQEALRRLALTAEGAIRWDRLEDLLEKAKGSQGYDATIAVDQLTNYLISDDGEQLLLDLADRLVEGADSLSADSLQYVTEVFRAFAINDEVALAKAFQTLQTVWEEGNGEDNNVSDGSSGSGGDVDGIGGGSSPSSLGGATQRIRDSFVETLPEASPTMKRFWRITSLLGARGANSDPAKLIPIVRKLGQEPRIQRVASDVVVRLGERTLSRSLRAIFGLPPPTFEKDVDVIV